MQFRWPMHNITSEGHVCNEKVFRKIETTFTCIRKKKAGVSWERIQDGGYRKFHKDLRKINDISTCN